MHFGILESFLIIIGFTLITAIFFRALKLPVIIGYLVVGSIIGPHALGWAENTEQIKLLAEFGVVLLMFTVGLEFSLSSLMHLKKSVFLVGSMQVVFSILITVAIGWMLHVNLVIMVVIGSIIAMSSTAIVLKQLTDQLALNSTYGLHATGILLFQDLAVIPLLVFTSAVSTTQQAQSDVWLILLSSLGKGILFIAVMLIFGRWLLRPIFHIITKTRQVELFTLTVLFVAISAAWLTHELGLSYALGAFIAGIMLAECEYKHQITVEIRPFRDILLGLFFISVGMLVNVSIWPETWPWILLIVVALTLGKGALIFLLSFITKYSLPTSLRTALVLAQGGEFGFAILSIALMNQLIPQQWAQSILAGMLICFIVAPIIIRSNGKISALILKRNTLKRKEEMQHPLTQFKKPVNQHVVLCGFGRVGKLIAQSLHSIEQDYIGLDIDITLVKTAQAEGFSTIYGDATHPEMLKAVHIENAKAIIISFDNFPATKATLTQIRNLSKTIPVIVRSQHESERAILTEIGANTVITAMFEEGLAFIDYLLHELSIPEDEIDRLIANNRKLHYQSS